MVLGVRLDQRRYSRRVAAGDWPRKLPVPVISVGNIAVGGTGKTPVIAQLASHWISQGGKPGIVSRGYRGGDGGNDEFKMLAGMLPDVPHVQKRCRYSAGLELLANHPSTDLILIDDGFQHRELHRDIDVVLLDAANPLAGGHCIPLGRLREPWQNLARADQLVLTRTERCEGDALESSVGFLRQWFPAKRCTLARTEVTGVRVIGEKGEADGSQPAFGLCGIGDPDSFEQTLADHRWNLVGFQRFPDHHRFSGSDLQAVALRGQRSGASVLVCTAKDAVKIEEIVARGISLPLPILALDVTVELDVAPLLGAIDAPGSSGRRETPASSC